MTVATLGCCGFLLLIMRPFNIRVQQSGQALRNYTNFMYSSRVVIAHRLSTVPRADQVVLLNEGKAMETGSWNKLLKRPNGRIRTLSKGHPSMH